MRSSVSGGDEVGHGFGLAEVELAVEVGALGELTWAGHAAAVLDEEFQDLIDDIGGAVTGDFHGVFAGVAVRGTEDGDEGFIDDFLARLARRRTCGHGGYEAGVVDGVGCNGVAAYGTEGGDGIEGLRAADADDGKSAPDGCGGGADGINLCSEW